MSYFQVLIFDRPVKDCPLFFDVTDHNPPLISFGSRGSKDKNFFMQPCNVTVDDLSQVYVVDTGNSRIKKLDQEQLKLLRSIDDRDQELITSNQVNADLKSVCEFVCEKIKFETRNIRINVNLILQLIKLFVFFFF